MSSSIHDDRYRALLIELRNARERQKLSQAELAQRLGRRQQFVSKYESGERRLDIIEFVDIATHLQIAWKDLLD